VLLVLSLAAKLAANTSPPGADAEAFDVAAAATLASAGFTPVREMRPAVTILHGTRGECRLILAEYDPHGTFDRLLRERAAPVGPLRFAWRGRVSETAPKAQALVRFYLWRELRRVRIPARRQPLVAWATSPGCEASGIDWSRLASLPA
jgi:hypothetical protein